MSFPDRPTAPVKPLVVHLAPPHFRSFYNIRKMVPIAVVASKQLWLAVETEEERKVRLGKVVATTHTSWPWRQRKKEEQKNKIVFLIGIDIGVF